MICFWNTLTSCISCLLYAVILQAILSFPCFTVEGYSCSRCTSQFYSPGFGYDFLNECYEQDNTFSASCEFNDGIYTCIEESFIDFLRTPSGPYPCDCLMKEEFRGEMECQLRNNPTKGDYCACFPTWGASCAPNKCDYSYQCGSTLYVCWNLVSPQDLGLETTTLENSEIENVVYCFDFQDNPFTSIGSTCGGLCNLDELATIDDPFNDDIIGVATCPNGETVKRYTKFCAPDRPGVPSDGGFFGQCEAIGIDELCLEPFCDYGEGDEFTLTQFSPTPAAIFVCPTDVIATTDAGECSMVLDYGGGLGIVTGGLGVQQSQGLYNGSFIQVGSLFQVGRTTTTYGATQSDGTFVSCSFDVLVLETQPPTIACPDHMSMTADVGACTADVFYDPVEASDNCPGDLTIIQTDGLGSGAAFPVGFTTRNTFQVTDISGNTNTCFFDVNVVYQPPPVTCSVTQLCDGPSKKGKIPKGGCSFQLEWTAEMNTCVDTIVEAYVESDCWPEPIQIASSGDIIELTQDNCVTPDTKFTSVILTVTTFDGNGVTLGSCIAMDELKSDDKKTTTGKNKAKKMKKNKKTNSKKTKMKNQNGDESSTEESISSIDMVDAESTTSSTTRRQRRRNRRQRRRDRRKGRRNKK